MRLPGIKSLLPNWKNAALAVLSAVVLILAFPDFEYWFLAWFGLVPLLWAVEREKASVVRSFVLGWIWGIVFFFGTCWWLTFAPITYAGFPPLLAYFLLFWVTVVAALFPGIFSAILSLSLRRSGIVRGFGNAGFIWATTEFLRYWVTGNNWNSIAYSQAFGELAFLSFASYGGIYLFGFLIAGMNGSIATVLALFEKSEPSHRRLLLIVFSFLCVPFVILYLVQFIPIEKGSSTAPDSPLVVAIQPNVPMSGLTREKWQQLRRKHVELAESALQKLATDNRLPTTVIFPESPMNFTYDEDPEFQEFVSAFAAKHNVNVLFNSAEPDPENKKYFNSAVLVGPEGREIGQYDKIYLVPFGESVPAPLQSIVPAFVGSFSYGKEYDLLPLGDGRAGVMICFESHFSELSREYVRRGADAIIEMTNDGYLGPTPVLRQHLANAVFRAVETNRPVLRVTNVGVTAYINERCEVLDPTQSYTEDTRVWTVSKSDGSQTFYVRYGDWFAWLCTIVTVVLVIFGLRRRRNQSVPPAVAGGEFKDGG